ncbi:MAG: putative metal-binding motif-containing protein [Deltaproteobacteria bacterium]|nr:putative metal-binding motif-containing protein [Deltaproteobacteria bacterium]MBM4391114.1 putative metal-binding motif-containing protein [Deltaproteobacteria bacterium]
MIWLLACFDASRLDDGDGDGQSEFAGDCDDDDAGTFSGADERCDGADNDCDGEVDEQAIDRAHDYADNDGDGHGSGTPVLRCDVAGAPIAGDCDDDDATVFPGAEETCGDGLDQDCDGLAIDCCDPPTEAVTGTWAAAPDGVDTWASRLAVLDDLDGDGVREVAIGSPFSSGNAGHAMVASGADLLGGGTTTLWSRTGWFDESADELPVGTGVGSAFLSRDDNLVVEHAGDDLACLYDLVAADPIACVDDVSDGPPSALGDGLLVQPVAGALARLDADWTVARRITLTTALLVATVADLDGDGLDEGYAASTVDGGAYGIDADLASATFLGALSDETVSLQPGGDVDGDGLGDLLAGVVTGASGGGGVLVLHGPSPGVHTALVAGESTNARAYLVEPLGDLDDDGTAAFVVSSDSAGRPYENGAAWIFDGPLSGVVGTSCAEITLAATQDQLGLGLGMAHGDLDGDGVVELLLGAPYAGDGALVVSEAARAR